MATDLIPHLPPSRWSASEFSKIIAKNDKLSTKLKSFVETLNYDVNPGQVYTFSAQQPVKSSSPDRIDEIEQQFWTKLAAAAQSSHIWDIIGELQDRFEQHDPASYLCTFAQAKRQQNDVIASK